MKKKIFPIGLGAMPLSIENRPTYKEAIKIIHHFIEMGGNFIDTANIYAIDNHHVGENERLIAHALQQIKATDNIIVATKGGGTRPNNGWGFGAGHPLVLRKACEQSLKNLRVSSIHLYYLHGPDPNIPFEDSIGELDDLKKKGKIQNIGIANVTQDQIKQAMNITQITAVQNRCNAFCKADLENNLVKFCGEHHINFVAYSPFGGWVDHKILTQDKLYVDLIQKYNVSTYTLNLAWLLQKDEQIIPIPGMDCYAQIDENFKAASLKLTADDISWIDAFPNKYSPIVG